MTTTHKPIRPGMTALAAVIALSSTAAFAQAQPDAAPVTIAPPAPTVEAAPAATPPATAPMISVAPPAPVEATTANASAPVETMKTMGTPVVHQPEASVAGTAVPVARRAAPVRRAEAPAPAAKTATAKPVAVKRPVTPTAPPAIREAAPAPVQPAAPLPIRATSGDGTLAIAGAGGLALVMIAGGAYALTRRRRSDDDVYEETFEAEAATTDYAVAEPMVAATPVAAASPSQFAAQADLPDDFDTSRFGRHVQAAYVGPTPENPSMSLRRRLARARFFDQRERMGESFEIAAPAEALTRRRPPARKDGFVTNLLGGRANTGFRPAYQG